MKPEIIIRRMTILDRRCIQEQSVGKEEFWEGILCFSGISWKSPRWLTARTWGGETISASVGRVHPRAWRPGSLGDAGLKEGPFVLVDSADPFRCSPV